MQNAYNPNYIKYNKVINIKTETLFREACDDFFYFGNVNKAYRKLKQALELTPQHFKSLMLFADVCFVKGYIKKSLSYYLKAYSLMSDNIRVLASVSNCYNSLNDYENALIFCNKAMRKIGFDNLQLLSQLYVIKINCYIGLNKFHKANQTMEESKKLFAFIDTADMNMPECGLRYEKLKLYEKLSRSNLKIV